MQCCQIAEIVCLSSGHSDMSILCSLTDGWIISHYQFINRTYESLGTCKKRFEVDSSLFQIDTPFARFVVESKNISKNGSETLVSTHRKRRKKRRNATPNSDMNYVVLVELNCEKMIEEGRKQGFFTYVSTPTDIKRNNAVAQNKARTFYSTHTVSSSMRFHGENSSNVGLVTEINNEHYLVPANCKFFCYDVKDIEEKIDMLTAPYDFVLLDPPWWNKYIRRKKAKCVNAGYQMMYDFELIKIPIASLTAAGSLVAVWCTNSENHLNFLLNEIFPAWDVEYIGNWFWLKVTHGGEPVCQFSEPPGKQPFEQIVFGHRKDANREQPLPEPNKVIISIPSAIHSHKPPIADVMAQYLPQKPRCIELFARYLLPGWTSWGYEVMKLQHLSLFIERDEKTELVECCNVIST